MKCIVFVNNRQCQHEATRMHGGQRRGISNNVVHYECEVGHKFHYNYTKNRPESCDCSNKDTTR